LTIFLIAALLILGPSNGPLEQAQKLGTRAEHQAAPSPVPSSCQFNGIQTVTIVGSPTGGSWQLSLDSVRTPSLSVTATARDVFSALTYPRAGLPITPGDVGVTGPNGGPYTVTFSGAMYNSVDRLKSANSFTGGRTPKVHTGVTPIDQTVQFQNLVNSSPDKSTLTLPHDSCWEIDGQFGAGNVGADMFINDPNVAGPSAPIIFGGTTTSAVGTGCPGSCTSISAIPVTTSGSNIIPNGTTIALTLASNGAFQSFVDADTTVCPGPVTGTCAGATTINVTPVTATHTFPTGSQMSGFYASLPFTPSNTIDVPPGAHIYISNTTGTHSQTFVTTGDTPPGSNSFPVTGQPINFGFGGSSTYIPIVAITSFTPDGTSPYDVPSGSVLEFSVGNGINVNTDTYHTTTDMPAFSTSPVSITSGGVSPFFPSVPFDTTTNIYDIGNFLHIHGHSNLTINGNGASLVQTACQPISAGLLPIVFLTQDTNLKIENLTITGAFGWPHAGCTLHGQAVEKSAGLILEDEVNTTLTNIGVFNVQGDGLDIYPSQDFEQTTGPLNTNITVSNSTFDGGDGGYHGLVIEAVGPTSSCPNCGAKFIGDTWNQWPTEMMDFEQDAGQTSFNTGGGCTSLPQGLCPGSFAQDNIFISNSTYSRWCDPWFTSFQGVATGQGIQEQNLTMTNNLLNNNESCAGVPGFGSSLMGVLVHTPIGVPPQYWTANWNISHNTETGGFSSTTSATCPSLPAGSTATIQGVAGLTITNNTFPVAIGCTQPSLQFIFIKDDHNVLVGNNSFTGAWRVAGGTGGGGNENYTQCGNSWGAQGTNVPPNPPNGTPDPPC
jgi:hypothetical protein